MVNQRLSELGALPRLVGLLKLQIPRPFPQLFWLSRHFNNLKEWVPQFIICWLLCAKPNAEYSVLGSCEVLKFMTATVTWTEIRRASGRSCHTRCHHKGLTGRALRLWHSSVVVLHWTEAAVTKTIHTDRCLERMSSNLIKVTEPVNPYGWVTLEACAMGHPCLGSQALMPTGSDQHPKLSLHELNQIHFGLTLDKFMILTLFMKQPTKIYTVLPNPPSEKSRP